MRRAALLMGLLGLNSISCKDKDGDGGGGGSCGDIGCNCATPATCNPGLECAPYGICIPPGGDGDGDGDGEEGPVPDVNKDDDTGGTCMPGDLGCECDNGACEYDAEVGALECVNGRCVPDDCPDGDLTCECKDGIGCDNGLDCVNGYCIDLGGGDCIQPYNECYDNDQGSLGECCQGTLCIGYEPDNTWGCATTCSLHSDCATDCCVNVQGQTQTYCMSSASFCNEYGKCIDTCFYKDDGDCDDGGPNSDYNLCEFGTDCTDCGVRY